MNPLEPNIPSSNALPAGTMLNGNRYQVIDCFGTDEQSFSYIATDTMFGTTCIIREFFPANMAERNTDNGEQIVGNPANQALFEEKKSAFDYVYQRLRSVQNPHVERVTDMFDQNSTTYVVMESIVGQPLDQLTVNRGTLFNDQEIRNILMQTLDGLHALHSKEILHLNILPSNIVMDQLGNCRLVNIGSNNQKKANSDNDTTYPEISPTSFFAPEQTEGNKQLWGPWTDFYALGATLYNLCTGNNPPSKDETFVNGVNAFMFPPTISPTMQSLVEWMMRPNYDQRPRTVHEITSFIKAKEMAQQTAVFPTSQPFNPPYQNQPQPSGWEPIPQPVPNMATTQSPITPHQPAPVQKRGKGMVIFLSILAFVLAGILTYLIVSDLQKQNRSEKAYNDKKTAAEKDKAQTTQMKEELAKTTKLIEEQESLSEDLRQEEIDVKQNIEENERKIRNYNGYYVLEGHVNGKYPFRMGVDLEDGAASGWIRTKSVYDGSVSGSIDAKGKLTINEYDDYGDKTNNIYIGTFKKGTDYDNAKFSGTYKIPGYKDGTFTTEYVGDYEFDDDEYGW